MHKHLWPLGLLLLVAGCQDMVGPEDISPPPLAPPAISQSHQPHVPAYVPTPPPGQQPPVYRPPYQPPPPAVSGPRAWIPTAPHHQWKWIVIHHSDTRSGSAASFDRYHRSRGWDELGYHFVIGNGNGTGDGVIEVGPRWPKQKIGAHAGVQEYNEYGIGICLVGNFDVSYPTRAQMNSLAHLVAWLMQTYRIPPERVIGHRDCRRTNCPGRYLNINTVRQMAMSYAAAGSPLQKLNSR